MVMATQNPVEQEGTYPLPEAQMDRFLMHVNIEYPPVEDEVLIVDLVRADEEISRNGRKVRLGSDAHEPAPIEYPQDAVFSMPAPRSPAFTCPTP